MMKVWYIQIYKYTNIWRTKAHSFLQFLVHIPLLMMLCVFVCDLNEKKLYFKNINLHNTLHLFQNFDSKYYF